ncbi:MAG TPA: DUF47 family protein [Methanomassiliicoccales archaeon]|nr:DUF47 family protein [Methanomassiliicoccales archaeon]
MANKNNGSAKKMIDRIFPPEYDFYEMLVNQTELTWKGIGSFQSWLKDGVLADVSGLVRIEEDLDQKRYELEHRLHDAFITPLDREEIYSLARQMDYIMNYSVLTAKKMSAYDVLPDPYIRAMADLLVKAMSDMTDAMRYLQMGDDKADDMIVQMRAHQRALEDLYIIATAELFHEKDVTYVMKRLEIYQNLEIAGDHLRSCIDWFHRILVSVL